MLTNNVIKDFIVHSFDNGHPDGHGRIYHTACASLRLLKAVWLSLVFWPAVFFGLLVFVSGAYSLLSAVADGDISGRAGVIVSLYGEVLLMTLMLRLLLVFCRYRRAAAYSSACSSRHKRGRSALYLYTAEGQAEFGEPAVVECGQRPISGKGKNHE